MVFKKIKKQLKPLKLLIMKEKYIVQSLNNYIHNKKFAKILYTAFNNENKPILSKNDIIELLGIKEKPH